MGKKVVLIYGEKTVVLTTKVPESKKEDVKNRFKEVMSEYINPLVVESDVVKKQDKYKEPYSTKFVPFTVKTINVEGYGCLRDDDGDICYWKDSSTTALVFDNEKHLKDYLIKHKP